jgi:hypothetical protein
MSDYQMQNCRSLLNQIADGNPNLNTVLIGEIERAVNTQSNAVFCLAYGFIDTMCKTILDERDEIDSSDDLPARFKKVIRLLNLVPHDYGTTKNTGISTTMLGLERAVQGLCELRNSDGIISHGKPAKTAQMDLLQIQFAAQTTDLIVHYVYTAHIDYPMLKPELAYENSKEFNDYDDDIHPKIELFSQIILPSWSLYYADTEHAAYKEALKEYNLENESNDEI